MSEPITFTSESFRDGTTYYEVHESGMVVRSDEDGEKYRFGWGEVTSIEDRPVDRIHIVLDDATEVVVKYSLNEFPVFLQTVCGNLAAVRKEDFQSQTFPLTSAYLFQLRAVGALLLLALVVSFPLSTILFSAVLATTIPLALFFQRKPISLTLENDSLTIRYLHKTRTVGYREIVQAEFEVHHNDYGNTLGIILRLSDRKAITLRNLEDIVVFFIMLQIKLDENVTVH